MTDRKDVAAIVWAETKGLRPLEDGEAARRRAQEAIAYLVLSAGGRGFAKPAALPSIDDPDADAAAWLLKDGLDAAEAGKFSGDGSPLPAKAALLPVDDLTRRTPLGGASRVPASAAWMARNATAPVAVFRNGEYGPALGLFISPEPPAKTEAAFVSALTGSGVPKPRRRKIAAWIVGGLAAAVFLWTCLATLTLGRTIGQAVELMNGHIPTSTLAYLDGVEPPACPTGAVKGVCQDNDKIRKAWDALHPKPGGKALTPPPAVNLVEPAAPETDAAAKAKDQPLSNTDVVRQFAAANVQTCQAAMAQYAGKKPKAAPISGEDGVLVSFCRSAWKEALAYSSRHLVYAGPGGLSATFAGEAARTGIADLTVPTALAMGSIVVLAIALGWGIVGVPLGVLVTRENRVSLAFTQVAAWTVVVLGAFAIWALFNAGLLAPVLGSAAASPLEGVEFTVYPTIPYVLLSALGITFASPMLSGLIKRSPGAQTLGVATPDPNRVLARRDSPQEASLADLFLGETAESQDRVDISRMQMVIITAALLIAYGHLLFAAATRLTMFNMMAVFQTADSPLASLPEVTASFIALLAISHASYLIPKAAEDWMRPPK